MRQRCGHEWHERFRPEIKRFYFISKEKRVPPVYHRIESKEEVEERTRHITQAHEQREARARKAIDDHSAMVASREIHYSELPHRAVALRAQHNERAWREEQIRTKAKKLLHFDADASRLQAVRRETEIEEARTQQRQEEMEWLKAYLREKRSRQWQIPDTEFGGLRPAEDLLLTEAFDPKSQRTKRLTRLKDAVSS